MPQIRRETVSIIAVCLTLLVCFTVNTKITNAQENIVLTDANPDTTITTGTTATVYGSAGANHVTIESGANVKLVNFPGSNTITIKADSSNFTVSRSGATVTFQGADVQGSGGGGTVIKIPATKTAQTIIFNDLSKELVISNNKVMLELDEVTVDSAAIRPVAGIVDIFINSENNQLSGFTGNAVEAKITITSDGQDNSFSFEIEDSPAGMAVSSEGVITYTIPADAQVETSTPFKVRVFNTVSNESVTLDGSIYVMKAVEIGSGTVTTQGGTVTAEAEGVSVEIPAGAVSQNVQVKIIQGQDESGNDVIDVTADGDIEGTFDLYLPELDSYDSTKSGQRTLDSKLKSSRSSSGYPIQYPYSIGKNHFTKVVGWRLPNGKLNLTWEQKLMLLPIVSQEAYRLNSSKPILANSEGLEGTPVLFIHGYTFAVAGLGGGEGTWGNFPLLIQNMDGAAKYVPFEFQWKTNARFEDVADDLGRCLSLISSAMKTNKKIHIIAHSFGGILTRTLLQKLNNNGSDYSSHVASVTTLGTPHSGIADEDGTEFYGVIFPCGQDTSGITTFDGFEGANQLSTYEMGEYNIDVSVLHKIFKVDPKEGKLAADLTDFTAHKLPDGLPIQVGIGLTTDRYLNSVIDDGDKLITYQGQRFHPDFTKNGIANAEALLKDNTSYRAKITEFILGFDGDVRPGHYNSNEDFTGYSHTDKLAASILGHRLAEAKVTDSTHASYIAVKNFLSSSITPPGPTGDFTNSLGMSFVGIPAGTFTMGSPDSEAGRWSGEGPQHQVTISKSYYMQTTEVTQGQWKKVMGSTNNPSYFQNCGDNCPVEQVSWNDIQTFITKLNGMGQGTYALPTEAQWEYAARAGSTTAFANGGITELYCGYDANLDAMGWYCGNANSTTHTVAQKDANNFGLYDMHGNVWEWCQDWYGSYSSVAVTDPVGPGSGSYRVIRGGSWNSNACYCRSASLPQLPVLQEQQLGFPARLLRRSSVGQVKKEPRRAVESKLGTSETEQQSRRLFGICLVY